MTESNVSQRADGAPGCVELLSPERLHGWLHPRADGTFPLVEIRVHGRSVRSLRVLRVLDDGRGLFRLPLALSLLRYVSGPRDLELVADGVVLPVLDNQLPERSDALGPEALDARFAEGHFVTKFGGLRLPLELDTAWQERTFAHYEHARATMLELFDYDVHVAYGTLLGITREGAFIDGDDDFDSTYHSRHTSARAVRDELFEIATTLAARGEDVQLSGRKFLHWYGGGAKLDLFPAWSSGENYFQAHVVGGPFAHVFAAGYREIEFKGRTLSAPVDAAGALAATYGPGWRTPDPMFQWSLQPEAVRAMRALRLTPGQLSLVQWERQFAASAASTASAGSAASTIGTAGPGAASRATEPADDGAAGPSAFAHFAAGRIGRRIARVIDLGCGDGRDTLTVAGGRPALGLDGSRAAVTLAQSPAAQSPAAQSRVDASSRAADAQFARVDVGDARALRAAIGPLAAVGPVAVYARRLLESIEASAEAALLRALRRTLRPGSLVILEVATHSGWPPDRGRPLHRSIEPRALVRRWVKGGHFTAQLIKHNTDNQVARVVLRRQGPIGRKAHSFAARARRLAGRARRVVLTQIRRGSPRPPTHS